MKKIILLLIVLMCLSSCTKLEDSIKGFSGVNDRSSVSCVYDLDEMLAPEIKLYSDGNIVYEIELRQKYTSKDSEMVKIVDELEHYFKSKNNVQFILNDLNEYLECIVKINISESYKIDEEILNIFELDKSIVDSNDIEMIIDKYENIGYECN